MVSAAGSLGMHLLSVPVPLSSFGGKTETQSLNGILRKIWSPHWEHPRKKWKNTLPWEVFMESRGIPCTHRLRTLMPEGSIMSFRFPLLIVSSTLGFSSKFLLLAPWSPTQISHVTVSNLVVTPKTRMRMSKFSQDANIRQTTLERRGQWGWVGIDQFH